eukprot:3268903-Alexandrium_andersonii.AAC.1
MPLHNGLDPPKVNLMLFWPRDDCFPRAANFGWPLLDCTLPEPGQHAPQGRNTPRSFEHGQGRS